MPEYLATVRSADGSKTTENVEAESADEAVRALREQGFRDIVLHTDDVGALYTHQRKVGHQYTPQDFLRLRNLPRRVGLFVVLLAGFYRSGRLLIVPLLTFYALALSQDGLRGPVAILGTTVILFLFVYILLISLFASGDRARYEKMLDALHWGRWEEALSIADEIGPKLPQEEFAFRKAQALATLGRLDEAMDVVEPFEDEAVMPRWHYLSRFADIYVALNRHDDAIDLLEEAVELEPHNATLLLGLASGVLWYRRDPQRARELIARARTHVLSDLLEPYADMLDGLVFLEEGRPRDALPILESARRTFLRRKHMILGYVFLDQAVLALARVHAALGDHDKARILYARVRPRYVALGNPMIGSIDREIGLPQGELRKGSVMS